MSRLFDTSPVPDDSGYWDDLARRVTLRATLGSGPLATLAESRAGWATALLLTAAALAAFLVSAPPPAADDRAPLESHLHRSFFDRFPESPPSMDDLLFRELARS